MTSFSQRLASNRLAMATLLFALFFIVGTAVWFEAKVLDVSGDFVLSEQRFLLALAYASWMSIVCMLLSYLIIFRKDYKIHQEIARSSQPPQTFISWWLPSYIWTTKKDTLDCSPSICPPSPILVQYPLLLFWIILEGIGLFQIIVGAPFAVFAILAARSFAGIPSGQMMYFGYGILLTRGGIAISTLSIGVYALRLGSVRFRQNARSLKRGALIAAVALAFGLTLIGLGILFQVANPVPMAIHQRMRDFEHL